MALTNKMHDYDIMIGNQREFFFSFNAIQRRKSTVFPPHGEENKGPGGKLS